MQDHARLLLVLKEVKRTIVRNEEAASRDESAELKLSLGGFFSLCIKA